MSPTHARNRAIVLASRDPAAALKAARQIEDPWSACQTMGWIARFAPEDQVGTIAQEALKVGRRASDPYRTVGSAAWPLRALIERDRREAVRPILPALIERAATVQSCASRSEALFLVYQAVHPAGRRIWTGIFDALIRASTPSLHWRQARNLRDAILIAASDDPGFAAVAGRSIADPKVRGRVERGLASPRSLTPRPFFWREGE